MDGFNGAAFGLTILGGADAEITDGGAEFCDQYARAREDDSPRPVACPVLPDS
jgi:hypothetical protein